MSASARLSSRVGDEASRCSHPRERIVVSREIIAAPSPQVDAAPGLGGGGEAGERGRPLGFGTHVE
jgi:hypothetical protein